MKANLPFVVCAALFAGCATDFKPAPLAASNPASVQAGEAPRRAGLRLLAGDALSSATKTQLEARGEPAPHGGREGMQHEHREETLLSSLTTAAIYTCPMHPEVQSDKPGQCPKCGMTLVKKE